MAPRTATLLAQALVPGRSAQRGGGCQSGWALRRRMEAATAEIVTASAGLS